jgi:CRISPR-associated protein Csm5
MTESIEYNIEALTPIHVGNGRELSCKYNYYPENGMIRIVDIESVIEALAGNELAKLAIKEFGRENFNIYEFLNDYSIKPEGYTLSWKCSKTALSKKDTHNSAKPSNLSWQEKLGQNFNIVPDLPQNIREHIKTAFGKPYLPGSSIKGSIRTAILSQFIAMDCSRVPDNMPQSGKNCPKNISASQKVVQAYFGKNPNYDILRCLHVSDAHFSIDDLACKDVRWFSLQSSERPGWRDMRKRRTVTHYNVDGVYVEALRPRTSSSVVIKWDRFLDNSRVKKILHFVEKTTLFSSIISLASTMNKHAKRQLEDEKQFFAKYKLKQLVVQHQALEDMLSGLHNGAFLMQIAWGIGWKGMTGNWMDAMGRKQMRELYGLGKIVCPHCKKAAKPDMKNPGNGFCKKCKKSFLLIVNETMFDVFPKTRRVVFENGLPDYPCGWIKLTPQKG